MFFSNIVFDQIYKNRKGTVRFALLRDRLVLAAGMVAALGFFGSSVFDVFVEKLFSMKFAKSL